MLCGLLLAVTALSCNSDTPSARYFAAATPGDPVFEKILERWKEVQEYDRREKDKILSICQEIDSLARTDPQRFADYLIGVRAVSSYYFSDLNELESMLLSAEQLYRDYQADLSDSMLLRTGFSIEFQICRKMDLMGEVSKALTCYEDLWRILPKQHIDTTTLSNYQQALPYSIARLHHFFGAHNRAEDWVHILYRYLDDGFSLYSALYYHLHAQIDETFGRTESAKRNYKNSTEHYKNIKGGTESALFIENNISHSDLMLDLGRIDSAALIIDRVLEYGPFSGFNAIFLYYQLAKIYQASGQPDAAIEAGQKTLQFVDEIGLEKYFWKGRALLVIGQGMAAKGDWPAALDALQLALYHFSGEEFRRDWKANPTPRSSDTKLDLLQALIAKASILEQAATAGDGNTQQLLEDALNARKTAVNVIKILRSEYNDDEVKEYLSRSAFPVFEEAIGTALNLFYRTRDRAFMEDAFYFFETSRGLSLLENLRDLQARKVLDLPEGLMDKEQSLKYKIANLEKSLHEMGDDERWARNLKDLLAAARDEYENLIKLLRKNYSEYFDRKYNFQTATLQDIQHLLAADESVVEFFYGEQIIYVLLITPTGFQMESIPRTDVFEQKLERFVKMAGSRLGLTDPSQVRQYQEDGYYIYEQLFGSLHLYAEKLILIPDGSLHYLPFNALPTDNKLVRDPRALPYLLIKHGIRRNFSASVWQQQKNSAREPGDRAGGILVIAPETFPEDRDLPLDKAALRAAFGQDVTIVPSPSKDRVKELFREGYDKIFIFTHAAAAGTEPYLQLQNDSLFLHELYAMPIRANLVLLSACETGLGKQQQGEGVLSLGRGFAYQNVPNSIMTLWRVQHASALQASMDMLEQLEANSDLTPSEALRAAQLRLIRSTSGAPFHWAGFVCTGE